MAVTPKFIAMGLLLLAALVTGIWLGRLGEPLNPVVSTVHKLLALVWVIWAAIGVYHAARLLAPSASLIAVIAILAVSMVALIASGSVLTVPKLESAAWLAVHRIATVAAVAAFAIASRMLILYRH